MASSRPIGRMALTINLAAAAFGVTVADIIGPSRAKRFVAPRHAAMWVCRRYLGRTYPEIARVFGGRDHTTVVDAVQRLDVAIRCGDPIGDAAEVLRARVAVALGRAEAP